MELTIRETARLLQVDEETIEGWIRDGTIPSHRLHDQRLFNRSELQEWAVSQKRRVSPELFSVEGSAIDTPRLHAAIERGGVYHGAPGGSRENALKAVAQSPGIPPKVNREELYRLLVGREAIASTGIGEGIAIPHPRSPLVVRIDEPAVLLSLLSTPADFHAPDGKPVSVLFTLLSPSVRVHLQMLAKIAYVLHDETLKKLLRAEAGREAIIERVRLAEESMPSSPAKER